MVATYGALFAPPGAARLAVAVLAARFPMGMLSLAATLMVTGARGSYTLAGACGAAVLVTIAVAGPVQARLVDRFGQARVTVPSAVVAAAGSALVLATLLAGAAGWLVVVACALSGLAPNSGSLARARWSHLHADAPATLHTAYAYEGVLDELCYILGPLAVMGIVSVASPALAYASGAGLQLVGFLALAAQRRTEPPVSAVTGRAAGSALRCPGLPQLLVVLATTGLVFGAQEITTIGLAQSLGHRAQAGWVLACYALGSCVSGVLFGMWRPRGRAVTRVRWALAAMSLALTPLIAVRTLPGVALVLLVAGLATAPMVSTEIGMVRELVPADRLTEGFTWTTTGLLAGISTGTVAAGWLVDHTAPGTAYAIPAVAAALALATTSTMTFAAPTAVNRTSS